jgi:hypothetical protein
VRSKGGRDATRQMLIDHETRGEVEGFTFVEIVIGLLIVGIFAATAVFAVGTLQHHSRPPDPGAACNDEATHINLSLERYKQLNHKIPKSLEDLVTNKPKLLAAVPLETSPSRAAGYDYDPTIGEYTGGTCPTR